MVNRVLASFWWAKAVHQYRSGDYKSAGESTRKHIQYSKGAKSISHAFLATVYLVNREFEPSLENFLTGLKLAEHNKERDSAYTFKYCEYHICCIRDDRCCAKILDQLRNIPASAFVLRCLPLPIIDEG